MVDTEGPTSSTVPCDAALRRVVKPPHQHNSFNTEAPEPPNGMRPIWALCPSNCSHHSASEVLITAPPPFHRPSQPGDQGEKKREQ
eukprot:6243879-Pyramimonas_sp.AAC.1